LATTAEINHDPVPIAEMETIATLYFPELDSPVKRFSVEFRSKRKRALMALNEIALTSPNGIERDRANERFRATLTPDYYQFSSEMDKAARNLLVKIMNVSEDKK
jgi:hypothetical protein